MDKIELLAPAKNLECGIAAIDHGADAVYIGAQRFGARVAAGNSVEDIAQLCTYAHQYGAKVYVTVNTIIYDEELEDTQRLLQDLQAANVDAILVQDMGLCQLSIFNSPLGSAASLCEEFSIDFHASTQTDNRTIEKVQWLHSLGFRRVVLARELSLKEIAAIHQAVPDVELEVFVHGALCVSYSGQCYASQYCFGRSANRGACAQFCRLPFDLEDADGNVIERGRHLLSLKDMCRIDKLEELMEAGAVSFKIEGRLKDIDYVKNVTAAYSQRLNEIIARHPDKYCRASLGTCTYSFTPNLQKTFNRGFTDYFLYGRKPNIFSPDTPKALGEYVGKVKEIRGNSFNVAGTASFANGDGLCFFKEEGRRRNYWSSEGQRCLHQFGRVVTIVNEVKEEGQWSMVLEGFRVNRAEGNRLYPYQMPADLKPGTALYRNFDQEFQRVMMGKTAVRKIPVEMTLREVENGFELQMGSQSVCFPMEKQLAQKPQHENIVRQLSKLGNTPYECTSVHFVPQDFPFFIPSSVLTEMRREVSEKLIVNSEETVQTPVSSTDSHSGSNHSSFIPHLSSLYKYPYLFNIANQQARAFYEQQGLKEIAPAFELSPVKNPLIMQCRHCLKYSLGYCVKNGGEKSPWKEPLYLKLDDGRRFRLEFQCSECQMNVYGAHPDPPK
ncbi:MAG: U32 family peptidase [Prevotella sp.]|nr:U32 family peptidase [Prevotella sp.]